MDMFKFLESVVEGGDTDNMAKAREKLEAEIEQNKDNSYINKVGKFLLEHLSMNPDSADKILNKDKTIAKSFDVMRSHASKVKVNNCAVLTDDEGFEIVLKYFDIKK